MLARASATHNTLLCTKTHTNTAADTCTPARRGGGHPGEELVALGLHFEHGLRPARTNTVPEAAHRVCQPAARGPHRDAVRPDGEARPPATAQGSRLGHGLRACGDVSARACRASRGTRAGLLRGRGAERCAGQATLRCGAPAPTHPDCATPCQHARRSSLRPPRASRRVSRLHSFVRSRWSRCVCGRMPSFVGELRWLCRKKEMRLWLISFLRISSRSREGETVRDVQATWYKGQNEC